VARGTHGSLVACPRLGGALRVLRGCLGDFCSEALGRLAGTSWPQHPVRGVYVWIGGRQTGSGSGSGSGVRGADRREITKGTAGGYAEYLEGKARASELGDYYLKDGERIEAPGRWADGAHLFGLDPDVPVTGEQLRTLMDVRRADTGGELRRVGASGEAVAALDATFSAPEERERRLGAGLTGVAWADRGRGVAWADRGRARARDRPRA
jgi:hypothetical protein